MNTLVINKKKYVVVEQLEYDRLREKAASKGPVARKLSLDQGKKLAYKLIDSCHKGKFNRQLSSGANPRGYPTGR